MQDDPLSWEYCEERDSIPNRASHYLQSLTFCHFEVHRQFTPEAERNAFLKLAILREMPDREKELAELRDLIAKLNIGMVINVAMSFRSQGADYLSELISEGFIALTNCIDRFNLAFNVKFVTFAFRSIRRKVWQYYIKNKNRVQTSPYEFDTIGVEDTTAIDIIAKEDAKKFLHELARVLTASERQTLFAHYGVIPRDPSHSREQLDKERKHAFRIIRKLQVHIRNCLIENSA